MDKFLIIDGNSIMNRAFYGVNARMSSKRANIHTNAIYGFLNIYWMILDKIDPNYVAVSFDLHAPTFRHKMYEDYKGTRKGMPDELREQMPVIKEVLSAMNIPILEREGYEADDILGTVAQTNESKGIFTYILTGDRDSFQLISDNTSVIIPLAKAGKTEYNIYTPEVLKEKQGIAPYQVVHIKALMGDASDNIPGVKGVGEKTAYQLIDKYTTLDNIYKAIDENNISATQKVIEKLVAGKDMAYLSFKLATIIKDVPIDIVYENCMLGDVNCEKLKELFINLEFSKFMARFNFSADNVEVAKLDNTIKEKFESPKYEIVDSSNVKEILDKLNANVNVENISYLININNEDTQIRHINLDKDIFAIYFEKTDTAYIFRENVLNDNLVKEFLIKFLGSSSKKLGFDIKQDLRYFFKLFGSDVKLNNFNYDLMIAYYLLDSSMSKYHIENILNDLFGISFLYTNELNKEKQLSLFDNQNSQNDKNNDLSKEDIENILKYLKGIYMSYNVIVEKLKSEEMLDLFLNIEMPLTETLANMEYVGMYIDKDKLNEFDIEITNSLAAAQNEIYKIAGEEFNINSTQQLGKVLFEKLGLEHKRKTKTGYSTDKAVLEDLLGEHEIIEKILDYRQLAKLKSTYVDGLKTKIASDGRIHTTFMQAVTTTGRLSSIEPNLQNIPVKIELGRKIRSFFVGQNDKVIVDADYSQIELRVMSHISNDEVMINAFKNDIDIHTVTASQVFNVDISEVTPQMRSKAKAVNFGIIYGISAFGLSKNINCSRSEAAEYINNYLSKYHGIREFMTNIVDDATKKGYVTTLFNRKRYIKELSDRNKNVVEFGKRIAMNTPIQGTAADIIKLAMNKVYFKFKELNLKSRLIMQVHDELIVEAYPDEVEQVSKILKDSMENIVKLNVPLNVDLNVGKSWYEAK